MTDYQDCTLTAENGYGCKSEPVNVAVTWADNEWYQLIKWVSFVNCFDVINNH